MPDQTPEPRTAPWPFGDLTPGTYTMTSTGDGPGDAVITDDGRLLVRQDPAGDGSFGPRWCDLTASYRPGIWDFEKREPIPSAPGVEDAQRWAAWFAAKADYWIERHAMGFQPWGRRVSELEADVLDARSWARHGYEIGQRSCTWSDHGVAPAWLTEGHAPESLEPTGEQRRLFGLDEENAKLRARIAELEAEHDRVYRDRAEVVAVLATIFPSQMAEPADETGWPALYLDTPEGQLAWPINPADLDLFNTEAYALALDEDPDSAPVWDRHSNEQQSTRLHRLATCYQPADFLGTETGTRPAAPQSDPAGYVVVTRNSEGGVHRSATVWDSLDRARAAEGVQAGYADGTGCTAAVYELREVRGDA